MRRPYYFIKSIVKDNYELFKDLMPYQDAMDRAISTVLEPIEFSNIFHPTITFNSKDELITLTPKLRDEIMSSRKEIENGLFISDAELEKTNVTIKISTTSEKFIARGEVLKFEGFLKVYMESKDDDEDENQEGMLPPVSAGDKLIAQQIQAQQVEIGDLVRGGIIRIVLHQERQ